MLNFPLAEDEWSNFGGSKAGSKQSVRGAKIIYEKQRQGRSLSEAAHYS